MLDPHAGLASEVRKGMQRRAEIFRKTIEKVRGKVEESVAKRTAGKASNLKDFGTKSTPRKPVNASNLKVFRGPSPPRGVMWRLWAPVITRMENWDPAGVAQVSQKVVQVTPKGSQRERRGAQRDPRKVPSGTYFCIFLCCFLASFGD